MFFSFMFIALTIIAGGANSDTALATNTVVEPVSVTSTVVFSDDSITAYVG